MRRIAVLGVCLVSALAILPANGLCHAITNITFSPPSPATLDFDERVDITFDYETDEAGGVRIWARPLTDGSSTPHYAAHGSPNYPVGVGSGTGYFTVTEGAVVVDQVRFQMWDDDETVLLLELFVDVNFSFSASANSITNIMFTPPSPAELEFGEHIDITFDYETDEAGGVRIWARPLTDGSLTPHYAAHGSPNYPVGAGSGTGYFTVTEGAVVVDQVRFQMWNDDETVLLLVMFVDVDYSFVPSTPIERVSWGAVKTLY